MKKSFKRIIGFTCIIVLIYASLLMVKWNRIETFLPDTPSKQLPEDIKMARGVSIACVLYSREFDKVFPENLTDLFPGFLEDNPPYSWVTNKAGTSRWIYHVGNSIYNDSKRVLVIESALLSNGKKSYGFSDGLVERMSPSRFQQKYR